MNDLHSPPSTRDDSSATAGPRRGARRRGLVIRFVLMAIGLTVIFGGLYAFNWYRDQAIAEFFAANQPPPTPVAAAEAKAESIPKHLAAIGSLAAVHQVTVSPEVGGRVAEVFFEAGAVVRAGDPLVQLNDAPEQADLRNYQAQAKLAALNLERSKKLMSKQVAAKATVDENQSLLDQANAGIAKTQAVIAQKLIRAPFDGALGIRQVEAGQYLEPGGAIVTLTDLSNLYVNFTLPEQARAQIAPGQRIEVSVDAYPGRSFDAEITATDPQVNAETRMIKTQATMRNPEHILLPGMFANVRVVLPAEPNVVTVPETAVDYSLYGESVFRLTPAGKGADGETLFTAKRTFVKTGDRFNNRVAILSGLEPGDLVAASGQLKLTDGGTVVLTESNALATPESVATH
jgi:multidrug efflux system membrane fusion protein